MTSEYVETTPSPPRRGAASRTDEYDPFARGRFPVGVCTIQALDATRNRLYPCEIWYPAAAQHTGQDSSPATQDAFIVPRSDTIWRQMAVRNAVARKGTYPLILFSHASATHRRQSTFLSTHVSSHGYVVAALDHAEVIAPELAGRKGETSDHTMARAQAWIANRVPDIRFLLDVLLDGAAWGSEAGIDPNRIGITGHSFGGWTALAALETEERIRAVVALAPGGSSQPKPGIIPATLTFAWGRDVPTLYLVAEDDSALPLAGMYELFERTRAAKRMVILRRADHGHFMDDFEQQPGLCSREHAHLFVRGLTLCHLDAVLKQRMEAQQFLAGKVQAKLAARGVDVMMHKDLT